MKRFLCSYQYEGAQWNVQLHARDLADAEARLARLAWGTVDGELMAEVPASVGFWVPAWVAIRNWWKA